MCGIAGVVTLRGEPAGPEGLAARMIALMRYRGPDESGVHVEPGVELGACRLAIVDVAGSSQPVHSRDGRYVLVFNGEIYNHRELKTRLAAEGLHASTAGDAEAVLLAFERHGEGYLDHLEGMFAFALWDRRDRVLRLARDRFGEKPLCYARDGARIAFASEAKALVAHGFGSREPDPEALHHMLSLRAVPAPLTLFSGIEMLEPGRELRASAGGTEIRRYHAIRRLADEGRSDRDWSDGLREHMRRAVRSRLQSDVPLGTLLSGGLDSTAVCALMAEVGRPQSFFIGFDAGERTQVDARYARLAAERLGTEHHDLQMTSTSLMEELPRILWHLEHPSVDGYQYFYAYRLARQQVTVALSGQGGDELFAGYGWFPQIAKLESWRRRAAILGPIRGVSPMIASGLRRLGKLRPAAQISGVLAGPSLLSSFASVKSLFLDEDKAALYAPALAERLAAVPSSASLLAAKLQPFAGDAWPLTETISLLQIETDLCDILLRDTDAVSMASSLEVRLPLLDHHLVAYVLSMPTRLKVHRGEGKQILKSALAGIVPQEILDRPKLGFSFPMAVWLRGPLRPLADAAFDPATIRRRGLFQVEPLQRLYRTFYEGRGSRSPFYLWSFVLLELWMRIFVDARADAPPDRLADLAPVSA